MGVIIPQVITEDKADGAQVIDGSLRFDNTKAQYITRTPSSAGNRTAWTLSFWFKKNQSSATLDYVLGASSDGFNNNYSGLFLATSFEWQEIQGGAVVCRKTAAPAIRDHSAWYHVVVVWDTNNATADDRYRFYLNGTRITTFTPHNTNPSSGLTSLYNSAIPHYFSYTSSTYSTSCLVSQHYFVDGLALDPSSFGYTDPLTNTWRPKKYTRTATITGDTGGAVGFGTNGFWLPFDGNTPIGQNRSGNVGIAWTAVNFGGSNTIEKATGALPILNTDGGGKVARVGVRTDSNASSLVLALPLVGIKSDFSNAINSGTSNKAITAAGNAAASSAQSNFYGGSFYFDGTGDYLQATVETLSGDFCIEGWWYPSSSGQQTLFNLGDAKTSTGIEVYRASVGYFNVYGNDASLLTTSTDYTLNKWQHIAFTRSGTTLRLFKDGIQIGSTTNSTAFNSILRIGVEFYNSVLAQYVTGYIQDVRVYNGVAKYTQNFIPASTDPDILPDTPSGVAYSSNVALVPSTDGAVAFDGSGDYLTIAASTDLNLSSGDFTVEGFVYPLRSQEQSLVTNWTGTSTGQFQVQMSSSGTLQASWAPYSTGVYAITGGTPIPVGVWSHFAYTRSGSTFNLFLNGISQGTLTSSANASSNTSIKIGENGDVGDRDLMGFISNLHIVKGTALYTSNFTPPTGPISSVANTKLLCCKSNSSVFSYDVAPTSGINNGTIWSQASTITYDGSPDTVYTTGLVSAMFDGSTSTGFGVNNGTTAKFISIVFPSAITLTTSLRVYATFRTGMQWKVNGSNVSSSGVSHPNVGWQTLSGWSAGTISSLRVDVANGNAAEIYAIEIDGVILKDPISPFGNAAATNFNPFTVNINTQRGQESGYCTLNPLCGDTNATLSNGNLTCSGGNSSGNSRFGTTGVNSGKWYFEHTATVIGSNGQIAGVSNDINQTTGLTGVRGYYYNGNKYTDATATAYASSFTTGDVIGVALNMDTGTLTFYKNGVSQGQAFSGLTGTYFPLARVGHAGTPPTIDLNFGQKPFKFPPPAGFQPLALANTPRPSIVRPDQYVGIVTYTGDGTTGARAITVGWKPDFVWIKGRNTAYSHLLYDTVRGVGPLKGLNSNETRAEGATVGDDATYGYLSSFNNNGFSVIKGSDATSYTNGSSSNYVAWAWKAGGNSNTYNINDIGYSTASAAGLTAGTITPTGASVNTKSGFSIITFTAQSSGSASISHGLGNAPGFIIVKSRNQTYNWLVYHKNLTSNAYYLMLNSTAGQDNASNAWNSTTPTSDVFTLGSTYAGAGDTVAYLWAEIPGFSKFGSYTGNNSTDGPVIITGFRPKWILVKHYTGSLSDSSNSWWEIYDTTRDPYNPVQYRLQAQRNTSEFSGTALIDVLSNGFKIRVAPADTNNASGASYIYAAFAETPSFNLYGGQANAR